MNEEKRETIEPTKEGMLVHILNKQNELKDELLAGVDDSDREKEIKIELAQLNELLAKVDSVSKNLPVPIETEQFKDLETQQKEQELRHKSDIHKQELRFREYEQSRLNDLHIAEMQKYQFQKWTKIIAIISVIIVFIGSGVALFLGHTFYMIPFIATLSIFALLLVRKIMIEIYGVGKVEGTNDLIN